jgi:hypothetical protein
MRILQEYVGINAEETDRINAAIHEAYPKRLAPL